DRVGRMAGDEDKEFARKMSRPCSLEGRVVDKADSLAYLNHDIDDGIASGCIGPEDLASSALWQRAVSRIRKAPSGSGEAMFRYQVVKELIDMQVRDLLEATAARLERLQLRSFEDVGRLEEKGEVLIDFSPSMSEERAALQAILNDKLYHHWRVERMTSKAKRIINELFNVYYGNPRQLPYDVYDGRALSQAEMYALICHYIASMTDRAALDEYKRLFNPYEKV
ncbi:MAG: hypothetical protein GX606_05010, partial [Elusimicrobia bacterium]|nr:hypothetical protein [Elusimicrobiota bacterium]